MNGELKQVVEYLSEKLQQPAQHVYEMLLRQANVDLTYFVFVLLSIPLSAWACVRNIRRIADDPPDLESECVFSTGIIFVSGLWTIMASLYIGMEGANKALTALFNPEYYALYKLFSLVK